MVYTTSRSGYEDDTDAACDMSSVLLDDEDTAVPKAVPARCRKSGPDTSWGLSQYLSDALPPNKWGVPARLDRDEMTRAAKYMKALREEHGLTPDQIRAMVDAYTRLVTPDKLSSPVGFFWSMRRRLQCEISTPSEINYSWDSYTPSDTRALTDQWA